MTVSPAVLLFPSIAAAPRTPLQSTSRILSLPSLENTFIQAASTYEIAANDPCEDRHAVARLGDDKLLAIVADGHGGWQCAQFVQTHLGPAITSELRHTTNPDDPHQIGAALSRAFERVDRDFIGRIRPAFQLGFGNVSSVGACALAAVVTRSHIIVANAGDCRAVLGRSMTAKQAAEARQSFDGAGGDAVALVGGVSWVEATPLSEDHNSRQPREQAQLRIGHPGEDDVIVEKSSGSCYVKGR